MSTITTSSTSATIEAPTREELVRIFAKRFSSLNLQEAGKRFDEHLRLGLLDVHRAGKWKVLLIGKRARH